MKYFLKESLLSFLEKTDHGRKQYFFKSLCETCYSLIAHFHALEVKKKYLYFEKVKKLFSMLGALLNDLFLSLRAFMYWVVRKIKTCRIAIGQWPFTLAKWIQEPNTTSHHPLCFLPVPQEVGVRFKGRDKHNPMSVTQIRRALLPQHTLLPSSMKKHMGLDTLVDTTQKQWLC